MGQKFFLTTYGCQMNKLDSELVASRLVQAGYGRAESEAAASVLLINTCSVREHAEDRVWSRLGRLRLRKESEPGLIIGVLGCMAQEHKVAIRTRMPHVDLVCGTGEFGDIARMLERIRGRREALVATGGGSGGDEVPRNVRLRPSRSQAFVNIIRGCNMPCTFCVVPATRGSEVCRPVDAILDEVERLVEDGVSQITLLGQTVNAYGHGLGPGVNLAFLLGRLHEIHRLRRISFVTSHPNYLSAELMETMARLPRVSRYLHLPAQSGSNAVLARMQRCYTVERYRSRVDRLRGLVPEMELASDFIAGFPGETEEDHRASLRLLEAMRFSQCFVFSYSPRPGTGSGDHLADDVPAEVKARRHRELLAVQERISLEKNRELIGSVTEVLVEGPSKIRADRYSGRTSRQRLVHFPNQDPSFVGRYLPVRVSAAGPYSLIGEPLGS
ncbi:MAG: tRNA (N6-isopentenyl adenosine(37)-C2)-methylthiotransferase MiaB [Planctomycetota bacterium]